MKICPNCGFENTDTANFCNHCGEALQINTYVQKPQDVSNSSQEERSFSCAIEFYRPAQSFSPPIELWTKGERISLQSGSTVALTLEVTVDDDDSDVIEVPVKFVWDAYIKEEAFTLSKETPKLYYEVIYDGKKYNIREKTSQNVSSSPILQATDKGVTGGTSLISTDFDEMDGHDFEYYCAELFRLHGASKVIVTRGSGDHGIDILIELEGDSIAVQCKRTNSKVGNKAVQEAFAGKAYYKTDYAAVITNNYFTKQATEEAERIGVKLLDRQALLTMIKNVSPGRVKDISGLRKKYAPQNRTTKQSGSGCLGCLGWILAIFIILSIIAFLGGS